MRHAMNRGNQIQNDKTENLVIFLTDAYSTRDIILEWYAENPVTFTNKGGGSNSEAVTAQYEVIRKDLLDCTVTYPDTGNH